ncbi:MAG: hypothetical protein Kow0062_05740 [Acidobacteriota bacterium]|nr:MAG: VWA domain-containing protein [Acidobacteriota bacterium]
MFAPACSVVRPLRLLAVLAALTGAGNALAATPGIEILQPRPDTPVVDRLVVAFRPVGVDPAAVREARIEVDGRPFATLAEPPFLASGPVQIRREPHVVRILVLLADGRELVAETRTAAPAIDESVDVRLVDVSVSVTDARGAPVTDLRREEFTVRDEGRPVEIAAFSGESRGLDVMLVFDASESMRGERIRRARAAGRAFVEALEPRDRVGLIAFHEKVEIVEPPTDDHLRIVERLAGVEARGGTALYDAVATAAAVLDRNTGERRKIVVVLSDGRDAARTRWKQASLRSIDDVIGAAHRADVLVYTVGLGANLEFEESIVGDLSTADVLRRIARSTGGRFERLEGVDDLDAAFARILADARHLYAIAFRPRPARRDGEWHRIEVEVARRGLRVRAREGYYARRPEGSGRTSR